MADYKGAMNGFHGKVVATVSIENGEVISATSEHSPHALIGNLAIQRLINEVSAEKTVDLDAVSGATYSSNAFINAAKKAQAVAKGEMSQEDAMNPDVQVPGQEMDAVSSASLAWDGPAENTSVARQTVAYKADMNFDESYDVVVAGSGGAGLAAAVEAARAGLSVLICEKAGIPGGTTNYSGGVMQAAGTPYQKQFTKYADDTAEKHANLWIATGEGNSDETLIRDLANGAAGNLEWLAEMGLKWTSVYGHAHIPYVAEENFADRIHVYENGGAGGSGTILTQAMLNAALEAGAKIVYDSPVVALIQDPESKKIHGVVVSQKGGDKTIQTNKGVVLATASIDNNPALAKDMNPQQYYDLKYATILTAATDTGDGIVMGTGSGAAVAGMGGCIDFDGKTGNATNNSIPTIPLLFVNKAGNRFVCEDATYAYQYRAIFQQSRQLNGPTYMIFGENSIAEPGSSWTKESLAADVASGLVKKANTLAELAALIQVPAAKFVQTVNEWNLNAAKGSDPVYGRKQGVKPLTGPFYAYTNRATNLGSLGGLKINVDCQVLDNFGTVIEGLYAAGLNAGGWVTGYYPGSGTAIAGIVHQGRKAGQHLAKA